MEAFVIARARGMWMEETTTAVCVWVAAKGKRCRMMTSELSTHHRLSPCSMGHPDEVLF